MLLSLRQLRVLAVVAALSLVLVALLPLSPAEAADGDVTITDATVTEADSGTQTIQLTVRAEGASLGGRSVDFATADVSATAGQDYVAASGTANINTPVLDLVNPATTGTISITVNNDDFVEETETLTVTLTNPSAGLTIVDGVSLITITNDDDGTGAPSLTIVDSETDEGSGDPFNRRLVFEVFLDIPAAHDITFDYDSSTGTGDTATPGEDYTAVPEGDTRGPGNGTLTFEGADGAEDSPEVGETRVILDVKILGDATAEPDETFTITLSNIRSAGDDHPIILDDIVATGTIVNDDGEVPTATSSPSPSPTGTETDDPTAFRVDGGPARTLETYESETFSATVANQTGSVTYAWNFGDGQTGSGQTVTHTWRATGTRTVTVTATDDDGTATDDIQVTARDQANAARAAGETRELTAVAVARQYWTTASTVVLATSRNFPDALAAGPYAAKFGAPLLLTPPEALPAEVSQVLAQLATTTVVILGGPAAVPQAIEDQLIAAGYSVQRVSGEDRFITAAQLSTAVGAPDRLAIVALGASANPSRAWPDALGAGGYASLPNPTPVLLSRTDDVPDVTIQTLKTLGVTNVNLLGGTVALSPAVEAELVANGFVVNRLAGDDRYATSVLVAQDVLTRFGDVQARPVFVTGQNFPDGLAAGALAAQIGGPVILIPQNDVPAGTLNFLRTNANQLDDPVFLGGFVAISQTAMTMATNALNAFSVN